MSNKKHILRLDASASGTDSSSRKLGRALINQFQDAYTEIDIRERDLNQEIGFIDGSWIRANSTPGDELDDAQKQRLALSDRLIEELQWAEHIVLTTPMYNFGVPASLKAWIDLVCRAGITFQYSSTGPKGLLQGKRVDIVITTGGAPLGSPLDFVSGYLKQVFAFIGIEQVSIIGADRMNLDGEASFARALAQIEQNYPALAA